MATTSLQITSIPVGEFDRLHAAICKNGRADFQDYGDPENGPLYSYDGHRWGKAHAYSNDKSAGINAGGRWLCRPEDLQALMGELELMRMEYPF